MTIPTIKKVVTFRRPFALGRSDAALLAGAYSVETDEELLDGISFPALYRRILTLLHLHPKRGCPSLTQILTTDPSELDAALERDQARPETLAKSETDQRTLKGAMQSRLNAVDRQAIDRAENEGMIVHRG